MPHQSHRQQTGIILKIRGNVLGLVNKRTEYETCHMINSKTDMQWDPAASSPGVAKEAAAFQGEWFVFFKAMNH